MARDITQLHPRLQKKIEQLKKLCKEEGLNIGIGECFRTVKEQDDSSSKVSVRSKPGVSARDVCAVFGGGGHEQASGCCIEAEPEKAAQMLLAVVNEVWK